jgi:hypothetical protein
MNRSREQLIASLGHDLQAVKPVGNIDLLAGAWVLASTLYVIAIIHLMGPIRPTAMAQLIAQPRFLLETVCGAVAIGVTSLIAFRAAVPGALGRNLVRAGAVLMVLWLGNYVVGLVSPTLDPSMDGKREACVWETLVYALPPMLLGYWLIRRLYPLQPVRVAMSIGLAAGMMPALYMQIACMYVPEHILKFHILPGLMISLIGALIAWLARTRAGDNPGPRRL